MPNKLCVQTLVHCDLAEVAKIHCSIFPESLIAKLGIECVTKYYEWQLESPDEVYAIGAFTSEKMLGYCFGGVFSMALGGFLVRNKGLIIMRLIFRPWLLFYPVFIRKILRGLSILIRFSKNKDTTTKAPPIFEDSHFGILAIATDPAERGLGVGRLLMEHSEQFAKAQNFTKMYLSVNPQNINAVQFYEHVGWIKDGDTEIWQGGMKKELMSD
jgi:ribosomal protein S18 acetylase RimI-like enzyme